MSHRDPFFLHRVRNPSWWSPDSYLTLQQTLGCSQDGKGERCGSRKRGTVGLSLSQVQVQLVGCLDWVMLSPTGEEGWTHPFPADYDFSWCKSLCKVLMHACSSKEVDGSSLTLGVNQLFHGVSMFFFFDPLPSTKMILRQTTKNMDVAHIQEVTRERGMN